MNAPVSYESLVQAFEQSLLTQLRGHGASLPFLDGWVPDGDPVRSILNMLEAAEITGEPILVLEIAKTTLAMDGVQEIQTLAEEFGDVEVSETDFAWTLRVEGIGPGQLLRRIAPAFRAALRARLGRLEHMGPVADTKGTQKLSAEHDGFSIAIAVGQDSIILDARHDGRDEPVARAVLDYFCDLLRGLTVREASDHAGHRLIRRLSAPTASRPVSGILLPNNADPIFVLPLALARQLLDQWQQVTGTFSHENEFIAPQTSAWACSSGDSRIAAVVAELEAGLADARLPSQSVTAAGLEHNILGHEVRIVVAFDEAISPADKPPLLRKLERRLQRNLDPTIELYVEELKDKSSIRRL